MQTVVDNDMSSGVWYKSACSGLWYRNPEACGSVSTVRVNGHDYLKMPRRLTAENGAKALLSGEFFETIENPGYCGCGDCDFCVEFPEEPETAQTPVSWTNIKRIYETVVKHFVYGTEED